MFSLITIKDFRPRALASESPSPLDCHNDPGRYLCSHLKMSAPMTLGISCFAAARTEQRG